MLSKIHNRKIKKILLAIGIIYIAFLYIDIFHVETIISSNTLKFMSIILCFLISFLSNSHVLGIKDIYLLRLGLFLTLIADLFLLVLNSNYIFGVFLFSLVQMIYIIRYEKQDIGKKLKSFLILFSIIFLIFMISKYFTNEVEFLPFIGLYYGMLILISLIKAIKAYRYKIYPKPNRYIIVLAMVLFILCDINVALYNILSFMTLTSSWEEKLLQISFISIWLFYLPSQVLLSLSGYSFLDSSD